MMPFQLILRHRTSPGFRPLGTVVVRNGNRHSRSDPSGGNVFESFELV
jgi:hypothetical protein